MNTCGNKDIACMAQSIPFGPSTPTCDNYFKSRCALFQQHMNGLRQPRSKCECMNTDVGREYICPQVGVEPGKKCDCFNQSPYNLGDHYLCRKNPPKVCAKPDCKTVQRTFQGSENNNQVGGGVTVYDETVNINNPVYNRCETVVHQTPSAFEGPVYGNLAERCGLRTNYLPSAQPGLDVSLVKKQTGITSGVKGDLKICNGKERCGNASFCTGENGCEKLKKGMAQSCFWDNRVLTSPWVYGASDIPSYYLDLAGPMIAGTPQWRRGTNNSIPPMMLLNSENLANKQFGCRQPCWMPNCI